MLSMNEAWERLPDLDESVRLHWIMGGLDCASKMYVLCALDADPVTEIAVALEARMLLVILFGEGQRTQAM
jgi:hypothetical protein